MLFFNFLKTWFLNNLGEATSKASAISAFESDTSATPRLTDIASAQTENKLSLFEKYSWRFEDIIVLMNFIIR